MWTILKVFIEFVTIVLLFYVLGFWPWGMQDLSSPTRDQTGTCSVGRWSLNHWTTREEVPDHSLLNRGKNELNSICTTVSFYVIKIEDSSLPLTHSLMSGIQTRQLYVNLRDHNFKNNEMIGARLCSWLVRSPRSQSVLVLATVWRHLVVVTHFDLNINRDNSGSYGWLEFPGQWHWFLYSSG